MTNVPWRLGAAIRARKPDGRRRWPPLIGLAAGAVVSLGLWALLLRLLAALF